MGKYQPYPEYKDSGVDWLGKIPSHWVLSRIKFASRLNPPKSEIRSLPGHTEVTFLPMEAIGDDGILDTTRTKNLVDVLEGYSYVANGDVMIAKITPCFENGKGAIAGRLRNGIGFATTEVIVIRPNDQADSCFFYYVLSAEPFHSIAEGSMYGAGGQKRVADSFVANYSTGWPGSDERENIAAFLDHETAKIDRLIARQERLIALLKEKRQAVISHAVTKGLNPDAPMKDSGVEWLGEVPAHWDVARVKFVAKLESGHTPSKQVEEYWVDCNIPWVSLNDSKQLAQVDYISDTAYQINDKGLAGSSARLLPPGAVVFTRDATIGLTAITAREMAVSQHLIAWLPRKRITSLFLLRVFNAMKSELDRFTFGATIKTIGMDDVKALTTTVPPLEEQEAICQYIDDRLSKFDLLIEKAERQISLLREHRASLISSAVTGKIDVRGWQKPNTEPQEAAEAASA